MDRLIDNFPVFAQAETTTPPEPEDANTMAHPREGWQGHGAPGS